MCVITEYSNSNVQTYNKYAHTPLIIEIRRKLRLRDTHARTADDEKIISYERESSVLLPWW